MYEAYGARFRNSFSFSSVHNIENSICGLRNTKLRTYMIYIIVYRATKYERTNVKILFHISATYNFYVFYTWIV